MHSNHVRVLCFSLTCPAAHLYRLLCASVHADLDFRRVDLDIDVRTVDLDREVDSGFIRLDMCAM